MSNVLTKMKTMLGIGEYEEEFDDYEDIKKAVTEVQRLLRGAAILGIIAIAIIVLKFAV